MFTGIHRYVTMSGFGLVSSLRISTCESVQSSCQDFLLSVWCGMNSNSTPIEPSWNFNVFRQSEQEQQVLTCQTRVALAGEHWHRTGELPVVAGLRAVEYVYETPDHRVVQRTAFSPAIGCTPVMFTPSRRSTGGLPTSEDKLNLVAATLYLHLGQQGRGENRILEERVRGTLISHRLATRRIRCDALHGCFRSRSFTAAAGRSTHSCYKARRSGAGVFALQSATGRENVRNPRLPVFRVRHRWQPIMQRILSRSDL